MLTVPGLIIAVFAILIGGIVMYLVYYAVTRPPWMQPWIWAVQAAFALIAALFIYELFFGGGLSNFHLPH